jgi:hypothetical protein
MAVESCIIHGKVTFGVCSEKLGRPKRHVIDEVDLEMTEKLDECVEWSTLVRPVVIEQQQSP